MKLIRSTALATIAGSVFLLAGCNSTGGYDYSSMSNAQKGAAAGAVAGALIESKGDSKDIATGTLAGAALGGAGGYVIDKTNNK